jgi:Fungal specific transcription factor domain
MPTFALGNQALLHAMLALGSLHIARVQDGSITASLKHYHIALRRIAKNVSLPTRRSQPATLAATMLLGWYEVMSSDHQKWSNHVLGAKQLLKEIDFAGMTRYLKTVRSQRRAWRGNLYHHDMALGITSEPYAEGLQVAGSEDEVNENLVSVIMGRKFHYDRHGQILDDINVTGDHKKVYTERDLEIYETQRDLFWWYCKQDMYQSVLSGSRLLYVILRSLLHDQYSS